MLAFSSSSHWMVAGPKCIAVQCVDRVERDYISNPNFHANLIRTKSSAAAGLCAWVINICKYFRIYQVRGGSMDGVLPNRRRQSEVVDPIHHGINGAESSMLHPSHMCCPPPQVVAPKRAALAEANKRLEGANKKLSGIRAKVKELQDRVAALEESLMRATEDKNNAVAQVGCRTAGEGSL